VGHVIARGALALLVGLAAALARGAEPGEQGTSGREPEVLVPRNRQGGWGGPVVQISPMRGRAAVFVGGRGGWLLDGRVTLGGGGFALATGVPAPPAAEKPGEELELDMGYGGVWGEYTFTPVRLLHVSAGALVGGGTVSLAWRHGGSYGSGSDGFFVVEPAVVAELNVTTSLRLDVGGAYRWIVGAEMRGLSRSDVAGPSVVIALKLGRF
jgi:hypothetical protein